MAAIHGLPGTMSACQIIEFNQSHEIRKIETPQSLRPHEILLKVATAGLCHSDLDYQKGFWPIKLPVTGSHEGAGVVVEIGSDVKGFHKGDRVLAGQTFGRCQECEICRGPEKFRHHCEKRETMMSVERNGAWQEYLVVDGREASHIPDEMSFATAAPLACAGATAWRGVSLCDQQRGEWIAIVGSGGGLGHLAIQFAKSKGLKVLAIDARDEGLSLSKEKGADYVLDARMGKEALMAKARELTGSTGVPVTLILTDHSSAMTTAAAVTKTSGTIVQIAVTDPTSISLLDLIFRDIRLRGSFMGSQAEVQEMLYETVKHGVTVENNLFHGLAQIPKAVEMLKAGQYRGKATIIVDEEEAKKDAEAGRI